MNDYSMQQQEFTFSPSNNEDEYTQLLTELHSSYCQDQPDDVLQYCSNFFNQKLQDQRTQCLRHFNGYDTTDHHPLSNENGTTDLFRPAEEEDDDLYQDAYSAKEEQDSDEERDNFSTLPTLQSMPPPNYNRGRRTSVSAESMAPSHQGFIKKTIPKTSDQIQGIQKSVMNNFLFKTLDEEHAQDVVDAMVEMCVKHGTELIRQGGVGDFFYVVQSGTFDCFVNETKVCSYEQGGSFGELALMYNAPRAATVTATADSTVWALDRITFRTILMENTSRKRKMYESFLEEVPLLKSLETYERHKIADALESVYFNDGEHVILQGDIGDQFYLIESGSAVFYKVDADGDQQEVNQFDRGSYFGELALLNDSPRAATVVAKGRLKCATLGKKAFTRLLGSVHEILKRNSENYHAIINQQQS